MNPFTFSITRVDDAQLVSFVRSAKRRLVYMGPGIHEQVAEAVAERWENLGRDMVRVVLDVDPEVARLGYGNIEGLEILNRTADRLRTAVNCQEGVRIGLVIADNSTLIFAPIPLLVEAESSQPFHPNAIRLSSVPSEIERELGFGENGSRDLAIGKDAVRHEEIEQVKKDLANNPPLKFDIARKVRVYNAAFEFAELELRGGLIARHRAPVPPDLMGLAGDERARRLLRSTFQLIDRDGLVHIDSVNKRKQEIVRKYLILLPNYGWVVLHKNKELFQQAVESLKQFLVEEQNRFAESLQNEMDSNRAGIVKALLPSVLQNVPERWLNRLGPKPSQQDIKDQLDDELARAFGSAEKVLAKMQVHLLFKGVTYELLNDRKFIEVAQKAMPRVSQLHLEFDAAKQAE